MLSRLALFIPCMLLVADICVGSAAYKPCSPREMPGQSVVCVCNVTYCDEIVREIPSAGKYFAYTTSEGGSRFFRTTGDVQIASDSGNWSTTLTLDPTKKYQTITGFGGAVTDAAAINWKNLTNEQLKQSLISSYYGPKGLQYNIIRTPIGGCDFSTHPYAYNEWPKNDVTLSNFSLTSEDYELKIPMIKAINTLVSDDEAYLVATTWSPPPWMKTNDDFTGFSSLRPEFYQTYADYHVKYLQEYAKENIQFWGITTTNEPINGVIPWARFNSLGWTASKMGQWIAQHLGPTIRNSTFSHLKIITLDDQRITIPLWFNVLVNDRPDALKYIDGIGVHYYSDKIAPASILSLVSAAHPDKFLIATEACEGSFPWQLEKVLLGSWDRAKSYVLDILEDLNHNFVGWIEWNLCLNAQGGPNWAKNFVDAPIIVFPERNEFVKQPMFYALGHFSKFIPRGSRRIAVSEKKPLFHSSVENVAFITPSNTVVTVLHNGGGARNVCVKLNQKMVTLTLEAKSVVTLEMPLYTGVLTVPDPAVPARMKVRFPLSVAGSASYTVLSTDYSTYAAIFTCQKLAFAHRRSATILSRSKELDKMYVDKMRTKLSSFGVDPFDLSIISQSGCPKHQNGTGVNINIDPETFSSHNIGEAVRKTGGVIANGVEYVVDAGKKVYHKVASSKEDLTEIPTHGSERNLNSDAEWLP